MTVSIATNISVHVPAPLRDCCGGVREFQISATSVRDLLVQLEKSQPALYRSVCDETGAVRRHVGLFVNEFHIRDKNGLDTALSTGDVFYILPAVSGG
ncbi:MAG: MoaD/ThiS family protein [Planctomycetes bacterium]|nr:MoaD/ThiS family protein [Planctomycetota bacterium]